MTLTTSLVSWTIKRITRSIFRVHDDQLARVPMKGPLIVVANHVNFLEPPLLYAHLQPRVMTGFAKVESWDHWLLGPLFNLWEIIPIQRGEADTTAIRAALAAVDAGKILAVAPEGTRSGDGQLLRGQPGVVMLAQKSCAPMLSMATYGHEVYQENLRRLRRTDFHAVVGRIFKLDTQGVRVNRNVRQQIADEIMVEIASLLPEEYHGYYAGWTGKAPKFLRLVASPLEEGMYP
jgi:1-acyl-sn-glycerol-3-phosphate acyltransferase